MPRFCIEAMRQHEFLSLPGEQPDSRQMRSGGPFQSEFFVVRPKPSHSGLEPASASGSLWQVRQVVCGVIGICRRETGGSITSLADQLCDQPGHSLAGLPSLATPDMAVLVSSFCHAA